MSVVSRLELRLKVPIIQGSFNDLVGSVPGDVNGFGLDKERSRW